MKAVKKGTRRPLVKSEKKRLRRNLQRKRPRDKNPMLESLEYRDDPDHTRRQRIMPRDEGDRRRGAERSAFHTATAQNDGLETPPSVPEGPHGIVTSVSSGMFDVEIDGRSIQCRIRGSLTAQESGFTNAVAVGDEVSVVKDGLGGVVEEVFPRRNALARPDVFHSHRQQIVVANADQLLIVSSWREPTIWLELIDRYLIAAQRSGLAAVICVNKDRPDRR